MGKWTIELEADSDFGQHARNRLRSAEYSGTSHSDYFRRIANALENATYDPGVPENWPPQPGDTWTDKDGGYWFCTRNTNGYLSLLPEDSKSFPSLIYITSNLGEVADRTVELFLSKKEPRLKFRRDVPVTQSSPEASIRSPLPGDVWRHKETDDRWFASSAKLNSKVVLTSDYLDICKMNPSDIREPDMYELVYRREPRV